MRFSSPLFKFSNSEILFAVLAWSLLILRFGYRFGTGDQVELLPYTLFLHDPTLYPHDFFMQGLSSTVPNERTVMAHLLLPFVNHLEICCFIFQFLTTFVLVLGLTKLAHQFIHNKYLAGLSVLVAMIPLNDFALGNVELYSECFQASAVAVAIIVWAILLFLHRRFVLASVLLSVASFIQVLEGLDVMIVMSVILLVMLLTKDIGRKTFLIFISIYALTAGIFLLVIFIGKQGNTVITGEQLFQILFVFRHPHHFIFSSFPKIKMIVFFLLTLVSLYYYSQHSSKVFEFMMVGMMGVIFYAFAVDDFHNIFIANFQFYKVTQWMKFLGVVAAFCLLEQYLATKMHLLNKVQMEKVSLVAVSLLCWIIVIRFNDHLPYKVPFQLFGMKEKDDMIAICEKIREVTPKDALFMQPFDNTELKFYGQRSSFVEFKANVRNKKFTNDWYDRIHNIYGLSVNDAEKGFAMKDKADANYYNANQWAFSSRREFGITHMLVDKRYKPPFGSLILENNSYAVYKL